MKKSIVKVKNPNNPTAKPPLFCVTVSVYHSHRFSEAQNTDSFKPLLFERYYLLLVIWCAGYSSFISCLTQLNLFILRVEYLDGQQLLFFFG